MFYESVCIKALTDKVSDSSLLFNLIVTICGNEALTPVDLPTSQTQFLLQKDEPNPDPISISSWFIEDSANSDIACF